MSERPDHQDSTTAALPPTRTLGAPGGTPSVIEREEIALGTRIGRYAIEARLGDGGMGVVYRAKDEMLQRPVAVKLLHSDALDRDPDMARRMVREARIAAKLSHPNVVSIYEVGSVPSGPFIAMEYVDGQTVDVWLRAEPRTWRDIVGVFRQAGLGIAAAHDAGVIHRDIKPSNILIASDRVLVADFGIAQLAIAPRGDERPSASAKGAGVDEPHTATITGTAAYAPPEQAAGEACDERSDVYSFCVALFESLYGQLPCREPDGSIADPTDDPRAVPAWLCRVVSRGLAQDPAARYPSFAPLSDALARDPARARRRLVLGGVGAAVFAIAGAAAVFAFGGRGDSGASCEGMERHFAGVWDDEVRAELDSAFEAAGRPYAARIALNVDASLDAFRDEWVAKRSDVCAATHLHGEQSAELLDLRMRCLDRRLLAVDAVVHRLRVADGRAVDRAMDAVTSVTSIECDDPESLRAVFPLPADVSRRGEIAELESGIAQADALRLTGALKEAEERAAGLAGAVSEVAHMPLEAAWLWSLALTQQSNGGFDEAAQTLLELTVIASRAHDDRLVARAWMTLMFSVGMSGSWDKALELQSSAAAALARAGDPLDLRAQLANQLGLVHARLGHEDQARAQLELSVALGEQALGPESLTLASPLNNLGASYLRAGEFDAAERAMRRVLDIRTRAYGEQHPALNSVYTNLGLLLTREGRYEDAAVLLEKALAVSEGVFPPTHFRLGDAHVNLATNSYNRQDQVAARRHIDEALKIYGDTPGSSRAKAKQLAGMIAIAAGDARAGLASCSESLAELTADSVRNEYMVSAIVCLGEAQLELGHNAEALDRFRAARALQDELGVSDAVASHTLAMLSLALWADGQRAEALAEARTAQEAMIGAKRAELDARIARWSQELK